MPLIVTFRLSKTSVPTSRTLHLPTATQVSTGDPGLHYIGRIRLLLENNTRFLDIEVLYAKQFTGFSLLSVVKLSAVYSVNFDGNECTLETSGSGSGSSSKCVLGKRRYDNGLYQLQGHANRPDIVRATASLATQSPSLNLWHQ